MTHDAPTDPIAAPRGPRRRRVAWALFAVMVGAAIAHYTAGDHDNALEAVQAAGRALGELLDTGAR